MISIRDLIVPQNPQDKVNVKDMPTKLQIRKPGPEEFIRVVGGEEYSLDPFGMYEAKNNDYSGYSNVEWYVLCPNLREVMQGHYCPVKLVLVANRHDDFFIWPIKLSDKNGRNNAASTSALKAAEDARDQWLRIYWKGNKYKIIFSERNDFKVPHIPQQSFNQMLKIALQDRVIDSEDHLIIEKLRGLV